jgi:hypothetical protein
LCVCKCNAPLVDYLLHAFLFQTSGPMWQVPTGRRDGRVSLASDAANLPSFTDSIDVQKQKFAAKGLNTQDLVILVGKQLTHAYIILHGKNFIQIFKSFKIVLSVYKHLKRH